MTETESAAAWSEVADAWERRNAIISANSRPVTARLLERLDPRPGERILDVGAGLAEVGLLAAEQVGADGHVLITDQSSAMVAAARRRSGDPANVTFSVADAQKLDLPAGSVDGIVSRFAYMLVPDVAAGLAEARRVLGPGGRLVFAVWASAAENPWGSAVGRTMIELGHAEPPEPGAPGPFRLADPVQLRALVTGAGFDDVRVEDVAITQAYASFDEYWEVTSDLAMSLRLALERLTADAAAELRSAVQQALAPYETDDGLAVPGLARVVVAKPS